MANCDWDIKQVDATHARYTCKRCKFSYVSDIGIYPRFACAKSEQTPSPSLLEKASNYTKSTIKHVAGGMKLLSQAQINRRLDIFRGCEYYKEGVCLKCGCPCNQNKTHHNNKLARPHEQCPILKWLAEKPEEKEEGAEAPSTQ